MRKPSSYFIGLLALLFMPLSGNAEAGTAFRGMTHNYIHIEPPYPAPDIPFFDAKGSQHRLSQHRGKVLLVNFWATWCPACILDMPYLDRLQKMLGGRDFQVLTISQDAGGSKVVKKFLKTRKLNNLPLYFDPTSQLGNAFGQKLLPESFLIDAKGRKVGSLIGVAEWTSPEAIALIKGLINSTRQADNPASD